MISQLLIGVALALATVALVLALWPVVTDAPWEEKAVIPNEVAVSPEPSQGDLCRQLIDALATTVGPAYYDLKHAWASAGCDIYIGGFAK